MKDYESIYLDYEIREKYCSELTELADHLVSTYIEQTQSSPRSARIVQHSFYIILCNLYYIYLSSRKASPWCIRYSRAKSNYRGLKPGYDVMIKVVDWLVQDGYCDSLKGFYDRKTNIGRSSRLRYSEKLRSIFRNFKDVVVGKTTNHLIRVKGGGEKELYADDPVIRSVFEQAIDGNPSCIAKIKKINAVRQQAKVTYNGKILPANDVYRVFNNDCFGAGGRFYGEFIQNQPKSAREKLLIDGEPVSELDFSSLHPRLLYDARGLQMPNDPYTISGFDRSTVKQAFQRVLNNPSAGLAKNSIRLLLRDNGDLATINPRHLFTEIAQKHKSVIDFEKRKTCIGLELQVVDSEIALEIMYHFADRGILCIGIHDSFIVQEAYEDELNRVMKEKYREVVVREYVRVSERSTDSVCGEATWSKIKFSPLVA